MYAVRRERKELCFREIPKPQLLTNSDVIIKVKLAGLCRTDKNAAQGKLKTPSSLTLGHEFSGIIEAKGSEVRTHKDGDRVSCFPLIKDVHGHELFMGVDYDGAFAEYVRVDASQVFPIPHSLSFKQAAYLEPIAASLAPLNFPLDKLAKCGIWGNNRISTLTLRILEDAGFQNLHIVDSNDPELSANSFDYIIETDLNDETVEAMIHALKPKGTLILKSRPSNSILFPVRQIVQKEAHLLGAHYGSFQKAIDLLVNQRLFVDDLFGEDFPLSVATDLLSDRVVSGESKKTFFIIDEN